MADPTVSVPPLSLWRIGLGPACGALVLAAGPGDDPAIGAMAAVAVWMAAWWATEAVPVAVTALLPLVLMPLAGLASVSEVAREYGRETIFLFLGGFLLALGLQRSGAHRRLALTIVAAIGSRPRRLVLGCMLAAASLSMWLSNTSTTLLLLPIALSLLATAREQGASPAALARLGLPLMLGVAHGATIGGLATPVGTPTNLVFRQIFPQLFPDAPTPGFAQWMAIGLPLALIFVLVAWWLLVAVIFRLPDEDLFGGVHDAGAGPATPATRRDAAAATLARLRAELGPLRRDEVLASALFGITALLWITGRDLDLGAFTLPGWQSSALFAGRVDDNVVAIAMAIVLFLLPSRDRPGRRLLEWSDTAEVPWGILLLFGGGFALAAGFQTSGLSAWAGGLFTQLEGAPPLVLALVACLSLTLLSEFASNTATAQIALPILASVAVTLAVDPRALMIPATLTASCAFMMPVGTPPASIVYATGWVPIRSMIRAGIWLNLAGLILVLGLFGLIAPLLGIDLSAGSLPAWAQR